MVKAGKESNCPFALAYIDIRMPPGTDGIETVRQIRQFEQDIEIVIMTAYSDKTLPEIVNDMALLQQIALYPQAVFARGDSADHAFAYWEVEHRTGAGKAPAATRSQ